MHVILICNAYKLKWVSTILLKCSILVDILWYGIYWLTNLQNLGLSALDNHNWGLRYFVKGIHNHIIKTTYNFNKIVYHIVFKTFKWNGSIINNNYITNLREASILL